MELHGKNSVGKSYFVDIIPRAKPNKMREGVRGETMVEKYPNI